MSERFSVKARFNSMHFAMNGLKVLLQEQHNFRVHLFATAVVVIAAVVLKMQAMQWVLLLILIAIVWITEALNTAVEYLGDRITTDHDPLIGKAKDVAAAAVLIASIIAAIGGLVLFIPLFLSVI